MVVGLVGLGVTQLQYFPSTALVAMGNTVAAEKSKLNCFIAQKNARLDKILGKGSIVSPAGGRSAVKGFGSLENAIKTAVQQALPVEATADIFKEALANPEVEKLFDNVGWDTAEVNDAVADGVNKLKDLFGTYPIDASAMDRITDEAAGLRTDLHSLINDVMQLNVVLDAIEEVLNKRASGELEEPILHEDVLDGSIAADNYQTFVQDNIVLPFEENYERFKSITDQLLGEDPDLPTPIFDLVYGPPVSVNGQFVLSEDGLYYDSRLGGIPDISGVVVKEKSWDLQFPPNLGGKGEFYTTDRGGGVYNTVLDYKYDIDDPMITYFQEADDVLETFEKDKARHLNIVSGQITELQTAGYADDSALVTNYYNSLAAVASTYDTKIKKRKKQLQLVALFGTSAFNFTHIVAEGSSDDPLMEVYGPGVLVENRGYPPGGAAHPPNWHPVDRVPINDFTFLKGQPIDVSLETQSDIVLLSEDLDDTLLPITPKFLVSPPQKFSYLERFSIDTIAPTEFVRLDGTQGVSGTGSFVKSLRDGIETSGLVVAYNFTMPSVVDASSVEFNLDNVVPDSSGLLDAQLVGSSVNHVFPSGLTIPRLRGTYYNQKDVDGVPTVKDTGRNGGSYVRLPSNWHIGKTEAENPYKATSALEDITYITDVDPDTGFGGGFSFDFWVYMPDLLFTDAHRYRLVLANENSGRGYDNLTEPQVLSHRKNADLINRLSVVHGLIMGFRDKGGTTETSGLEFCILPTVSQNKKDPRNDHSICIAEKYTTFNAVGIPDGSGLTELGFKADTTVSTPEGATIKDASAAFTHFSVTFNTVTDLVTVYVDGHLLKQDTFSTGFDLALSAGLGIPTFTRAEESTTGLEQDSYNNNLYNGPNLGRLGIPAFTPWILGGGFTDGIDTSGFLGANTNDAWDFSGIYGQHVPNLNSKSESGLDGFIGSFKVYNRPLTSSEVLKNFKAQKGFFKNIFI